MSGEALVQEVCSEVLNKSTSSGSLSCCFAGLKLASSLFIHFPQTIATSINAQVHDFLWCSVRTQQWTSVDCFLLEYILL